MPRLTFAVAAIVAMSLPGARVQAQADQQLAMSDQSVVTVEVAQLQMDEAQQAQLTQLQFARDAQQQVDQEVLAEVNREALARTSETSQEAAAATPTGPSMDAATLSPRLKHHNASSKTAMHRRPSPGAGVAFMILGGAALITGLVIGDDAGTVIAVGGALVGLYGLYIYLGRPHGMEQNNRIGLGYKLSTN
jgi:hypothetical protein